MKVATIFALPPGLLSRRVIVGCNGDVPTAPEQGAIGAEAPLEYRIKPDGTGADKNKENVR